MNAGTLSKRDTAFLNLAMKTAELSEARHKHGAVIVRGGSVLALGFNRTKNHPDVIGDAPIRSSCGDHAEVAAIKRAKSTKGAVLYVARVAKTGKPANSKPCISCQIAIDIAGIKRVIYTL